MLRLIGWMIKTAFFAVSVLVAANLVHWNGRTVDDQIRTRLWHAERGGWLDGFKNWNDWDSDGSNSRPRRQGVSRGPLHRHWPGTARTTPGRGVGPRDRDVQAVAQNGAEGGPPQEKVSPSERQKLRALIQELNTGGGTDARN